jgi:hypothetical protein
MKLTQFTPITMPNGRNNRPNLTPLLVSLKSGLFCFNRAACELLKLKTSSCVIISQDADNPLNWYVSENANGYKLRQATTKRTVNYIFAHQQLRQRMLTSLDLDGSESNTFIIAGKPTIIRGDQNVYHGLISKVKLKI